MNVSSLVDNLMEFHNAGVPKVRESIDLPVDSLLGFTILQILLVVGFDRNHMLGLFVSRTADDGKSALANLQIYLEFIKLKRLFVRELLSSTVDQVSEVAQRGKLMLRLQLSVAKLVFSQRLGSRHWSRQTRERLVPTHLLAKSRGSLLVFPSVPLLRGI